MFEEKAKEDLSKKVLRGKIVARRIVKTAVDSALRQ